MASPLTDRSVAPYAPADDVAAGPLPDHVVRAVAEIAGAAGVWCPALSPDGARVAYVTVDRLTSPVLFAHGDRDTNVPVAESVQAHQALQALGARSELLLLPGEGHTIVDREHVVELSAAVVAWFDRWL